MIYSHVAKLEINVLSTRAERCLALKSISTWKFIQMGKVRCLRGRRLK